MTPALRQVALGLLTYVPGLHARLRRGTGGTNSAAYCYAVWMRHLQHLEMAGLETLPRAVAEIGPGDSLGIGLSALLCGAECYLALDAVPHAATEANLKVFDALVDLFRVCAPVPGLEAFPHVKPEPLGAGWPALLTPERMAMALSPDRVARLRSDLAQGTGALRYIAPWEGSDLSSAPRIDLFISQAVLEHVDRLEEAYAAMASLAAPESFMSHQIDFRCHGTAASWNGHLAYSDGLWTLMRGRRPYLLNRRLPSEHLALIEQCGFDVRHIVRATDPSGRPADELAARFRAIGPEDHATSGLYVAARRRSH
ncbi:MAG: hypothetical protein SNJ79_13670 [Sphingomonadaceae bacterium]